MRRHMPVIQARERLRLENSEFEAAEQGLVHKEIVSATNRYHYLSSQLEARGCSFLFTIDSQSIKMCIVDAQHYLTR